MRDHQPHEYGAAIVLQGVTNDGERVDAAHRYAFASKILVADGEDGRYPLTIPCSRWISFPLVTTRLWGVVLLVDPRAEASTPQILNLLQYALSMGYDLNERLRRERLERMTDPMTGVLRREAFDRLVEQSTRGGILVSIDANNLKTINDTQGHAAGDAYLIRIAQSLRSAFRDYDRVFVGRRGGDEFALFLPSISCAVVEKRLREQQQRHDVSYAYGCVECPREATSYTRALELADQRMYTHKQREKMAV